MLDVKELLRDARLAVTVEREELAKELRARAAKLISQSKERAK